MKWHPRQGDHHQANACQLFCGRKAAHVRAGIRLCDTCNRKVDQIARAAKRRPTRGRDAA